MIDMERTHDRIERGITKILYQTDHVLFLKACRDYRRSIFQEQGSGQSLFLGDDPEFQELPAVILAIEPGWVSFRENDVLIGWAGGITGTRWVEADVEGVTNERSPLLGYRRLTNGLWYYDEGIENNSEYDKWLDELRPEPM